MLLCENPLKAGSDVVPDLLVPQWAARPWATAVRFWVEGFLGLGVDCYEGLV